MSSITLILVEPSNAGNVGAVARLMANFGFKNLAIINPKCDIKSSEAIARAMHGKPILDQIKIIQWGDLGKFATKIATTARHGTDYNIPRSPLTPVTLAVHINQLKNQESVAIIFGREDHGLSNEELSNCDFTVTIPTQTKEQTLNVSHAVAIILYELQKEISEQQIIAKFKQASPKEKEHFMRMFNELIKNIDFGTDAKKKTQLLVWKKVLAKALLTKREIMAMFGLVKKLKPQKKNDKTHL